MTMVATTLSADLNVYSADHSIETELNKGFVFLILRRVRRCSILSIKSYFIFRQGCYIIVEDFLSTFVYISSFYYFPKKTRNS